MANILGIKGFNKSSSSVNKLLAAYGNDIVDVSTGLGYGLALNGNQVEMEVFLDRVFMQNYNTRPKTFNGTAWSTEYVPRTMTSKYIRNYKEKARMYLGNCLFTGPQVPLDKDNNAIVLSSYIFASDLFVGNNLTWGMEWGTNGTTTADTNIFQLVSPLVQDFKASNIKVGDALFITNGNNQLISKPYFVSDIPSAYRLLVTENFPVTASGLHYWVGSNFFPVATDDNDQITGLGENSTRLLIFKLMSLWFYTGSQLRQVKDAVGTSSQRSVVNKGGYTYYFHGSDPKISGIYRYDGVSSQKISRAIDPYIDGMSTASYDDVVAWREGDELRWFLGNITNTNRGISMTNAVASLNVTTNAWDVSPIADVITCSTVFRTNNREDTYNGTSDDEVLQMVDGNSFNTTAIHSRLETKVYYPSGSGVINENKAIQVIGRATKGVRVEYKLWNTPKNVDDRWLSLGELDADKTELDIPTGHNESSGIQLAFDLVNTLENDTYIEKYTIFYRPQRTRL